MKLIKEQRTEIDNMEISERVELIRDIFWNGVKYNKDFTEVIGFDSYETTPENMEHFLMGATAIFDVAQMSVANHWHGNPDTDKICQAENDFLLCVMESAFETINPSQMMVWKQLNEQEGNK